jgi:hypothetical protein
MLRPEALYATPYEQFEGSGFFPISGNFKKLIPVQNHYEISRKGPF